MQLSFLAKDPFCVRRDQFQPVKGQPDAFVGRNYAGPEKAVEAAAAGDLTIAYPASNEPFRCDSESREGRRLLKRLLRGEHILEPADAATASACGLPWATKPKASSGEKTTTSKRGGDAEEQS